jgi:ABC-type dipeptide/oligopeptide/nickel transport system ATPase subunit
VDDAALGQVGLSLTEVRGRYPHELSGGQLQRVAVDPQRPYSRNLKSAVLLPDALAPATTPA